MKKVLIFASIIMSISFISCDLFEVNLPEYFEEYTNNAAIELHEFDNNYPIVSSVENLPSTSGDKIIKFTLRNPQKYTLNLTQTGLTGTELTDYTLTQSDDKNSIILTLKENYLQNIDKNQTAGEDNLSVTINIVDSVSKRQFESYTLNFIVNTPPPAVTKPAIYSSAGKWVIAFEFPTFDEEHRDIKTVNLNGKSFSIDNSSGSVTTLPSGFTSAAPDSLFTATYTKVTGLSANTVYYQTDTYIDNSFSSTIELIDDNGLTSSASTNQGGLDSILLPVIETDGKWNGETGVRTVTISDALGADIYYTTDGTKPTTESPKYIKEFDLNLKNATEDIIVKALAVKTNYVDSPIVTEVFAKAKQVVMPTVKVATNKEITIESDTDGASFAYIIDGTADPTTASNIYDSDSKPFIAPTTYTNISIKAIASKDGMLNSDIGTGYFITDAYVNGSASNDTGIGYDESSAVKTFATAKSKLTTGSGTIWVTGTLKAGIDEKWDGDGKNITVKRHRNNTGEIVIVESGNSLTISNITLDGNSAVSTTYRIVKSNGTLELNTGAIIQNGQAGGVSVWEGTFTMNGGSIQNNKTKYGGGVYCKSTFIMKNGTISGNESSDTGGGVWFHSDSTFTLSGTAKIENNTSGTHGGGIYVKSGTTTMSETSSIQNNEADFGGGVSVNTGTLTMNDESSITRNSVSNSGGGIYLNGSSATLKLSGSPKVTGNTWQNKATNIAFSSNKSSSPIQITGLLASDAGTIGLAPTSTDANNVLAVSGGNYTIQYTDIGAFSLDVKPDGVALDIIGQIISGGSGGFYTEIYLKAATPASDFEGTELFSGTLGKYKGSSFNVVIPAYINGEAVTGIATSAFQNKTITSVTIPNGVKTIGAFAFNGCDRLTSITIPNSVTTIAKNTFASCTKLTSIKIPASVTSIGEGVFTSCTSLGSISVDSENKNYKAIDNVLYDKNSTKILQYSCTKEDRSFNIPPTVTRIGNGAFCNSKLTSITIPTSVTSIGESAFQGCSLNSLTIPDTVTTIGDYTFRQSKSLESIKLPANITKIGTQAFNGCTALENITIPEKVTSIGELSFNACSKLTSVTIPSSVLTIDKQAFYNCPLLSNITIPNSVQTIGESAFNYCSGLEEITIPISVTTIAQYAFNNCSKLTTVYTNYTKTDDGSSGGAKPYPVWDNTTGWDTTDNEEFFKNATWTPIP